MTQAKVGFKLLKLIEKSINTPLEVKILVFAIVFQMEKNLNHLKEREKEKLTLFLCQDP